MQICCIQGFFCCPWCPRCSHYFVISGQIWGNLISSQVFGVKDNKTITEEELESCGANFCPSSADNNTNLDKPAIEKVLTILNV